jgi:hypothetical protein
MINKFFRCYLAIFQIILVVTLVAKLLAFSRPSGLLGLIDPILGIKNETLIQGMVIIEVFIVVVLYKMKSSLAKLLTLFGFSMAIGYYRFLKMLWGIGAPCLCLGTYADWWPWLARNGQTVAEILSVYMVLSSIVMMVLFCFFEARGRSSIRDI